jgi:hypothetical protein
VVENLVKIILDQAKFTNIYSIIYDGRSGSVFLQSLLDNHTKIINFPATVLMGGLFGRHINELLVDSGPKSWDEFIDTFIAAYPTLFNTSNDSSGMRLNELGKDKNAALKIDVNEFRNLMISVSKQVDYTKRNAFISIHIAWEFVRKKTIDSKPIILYAMHTPENSMKVVMDLFPEMKVFLSTREPKSTLASYFWHHVNRYSHENNSIDFWSRPESISYPYSILKYYLEGYSVISAHVKSKNIRAVRLEDLHENPIETMKRICNWMEINYESCLTESTFGGLLHWGDITIEHKTGPSYSRLKFDWRNSYYWSDVILIESALERRYANYSYQKEFNTGTKFSSDQDIINNVYENFPMKFEIIALSRYLKIDEQELYNLIKSKIEKYGKKTNFSFLRNLKTSFSKPNKEEFSYFFDLMEARKKIFNEYIKKNEQETLYDLI